MPENSAAGSHGRCSRDVASIVVSEWIVWQQLNENSHGTRRTPCISTAPGSTIARPPEHRFLGADPAGGGYACAGNIPANFVDGSMGVPLVFACKNSETLSRSAITESRPGAVLRRQSKQLCSKMENPFRLETNLF